MSDPLSITASVIAVLELAATTTRYLREIKHGAADRLQLRDELRSTTYLLEMLRDRIDDAEDAAVTLGMGKSILTESLVGLDGLLVLVQSVLQDIISRLCPQSKFGQRSLSLTWPFTKKDITEKLACLERLKGSLSLVLQNDLIKMVQSSHRELTEIGQKVSQTKLKDEEDLNERILLWLSPFPFHKQHDAILETVQAGTGGWFMKHEKVCNWLEGNISMLWSIVVDTLEHKLASKNALCTYIYCNYGRRNEQTPVALLSSLLLQVLRHSKSGTVPSEISSLYNSHKKLGTRPTWKELFDIFTKMTLEYETTFIVIDALDEYSESENDALWFLSTISSVGSKVKIMCSSRFSTTFDAYFNSIEKVEISARDEDIELFLDSEIARLPTLSSLSKHLRAEPDLRRHIIVSITGECQGMFLLAKLHLESLLPKINRKAVRLALASLPGTLNDTYSDALERIRDQPAEMAELAELVLLWVICARQNLTVMQLQHMYAMQELVEDMALEDDDLPDGDVLTAACGGLITVDKESQAINVIHYTAQQYFEISLAPKLMTARISLTKVSLAYLVLPNFSTGFCTSDTAMAQRLREYPFIEYAAKNWGSEMNLIDAGELLPDLERLWSNPVAVEMTSQVWSLSNARYPNWSQEFPRNCPALVLAAVYDLPAILRQMIANGHDIEGRGSDEETALIRAATFGQVANVRTLLELGAEVDAQDYMNETALHRAARKGNEEIIRVLIGEGAGVNNKASSNWTALMLAVSCESLNAVRILVEAGAELMSETEWGDTALTMALRSGKENIAVFLADHGAVLPRGLAGRRAFTIACQRGLQHVAQRLTLDYEAVAGRPLQRQSSRLMGGLPQIVRELPQEESTASGTETEPSDEVSLGELMEQYNIKTGFDQRYKITQKIGNGHSATVHLCTDRVTGMVFAVKVLEGVTPGNPLRAKNFKGIGGEIQLLRELQKHYHPNLHELGWVHRDIKPENILICDDHLSIQLCDFGLAKKIGTKSASDGLTTTLCGTPTYVAPEIIVETPHRRYGFEVDIWSSGVVLYICLCGFPPFADELNTPENPYNLAQQIKMGRFDYPSPYWDPIGDPALDLIDRMLTVYVPDRISARDCLTHPWMCQTSN
ncbi:serine/threonine-protein kinase chk2 [Aspergillus niger]|uniref:Serine/threonine-protein kinase chk2 n=1 Tax=Aspergillus niger TaxID=5061 RepID=A0A100IJP2_ASPNG|nr:serine/threonine-protein kinase chk2 [Aspergillus niger]